MKRTFAIALLIVFGVATAEARKKQPAPRRARLVEIRKKSPVAPAPRSAVFNVAPRGESELERNLQSTLDGVLGGGRLKSAINGLYVVDARTGRVLYAYGEDRQLNPASNTKLVSTATALDALGADFTYDLRLLGRAPGEDGVVEGDVYLVGAGDPTLGPRGLDDLARSLAAAGVRHVNGAVVVGDAARDAVARPYVTVTVRGTTEGDLPDVEISPDSGYFVVDTTAITSEKHGKLDVTLAAEDGGILITVSGRVKPGQVVEASRPVPGAAPYTAHTFRALALRAGVDIAGGVRQATGEPPALDALAVHHSVPLSQLAALINKPSNNYLADRLIATVGGERFGGAPTMSKGVQAMSDWLARVGVSPGSYRLENGSGLSHAIHISARQLVQVLLFGAEELGAAWVDSLSVGGRDGTLKYRFASRPSAGHVKAKTGTLNGVATLSGFVAVGDEELCFSFLTSGFRHRRKDVIRAGQADAVDAMYRYLVARGGKDAPPAAAPEPAPAPAPAEGPPGEDPEDNEGDGIEDVP
ncbi:MAG TPA: D-alanyl-D-alanine carboxypeptidase/D-alanyl-D-alanine-endopeptidase [Haliangiales bacterium]|nr:D-alanyl-D-alanine carboxypeptidase/D-alanyl-D-alanine-endopeptidase [Haliangiales bacterium]